MSNTVINTLNKSETYLMETALGPAKAEKSLAKIVTECEHVQKRNILDFLYVHGSIESLSAVDKLTVGEHEGVTSKAIHAKIGIL